MECRGSVEGRRKEQAARLTPTAGKVPLFIQKNQTTAHYLPRTAPKNHLFMVKGQKLAVFYVVLHR